MKAKLWHSPLGLFLELVVPVDGIKEFTEAKQGQNKNKKENNNKKPPHHKQTINISSLDNSWLSKYPEKVWTFIGKKPFKIII